MIKQRVPAAFTALAVGLASILLCAAPGAAQPWHFTEVSAAAGVSYTTGFGGGLSSPPEVMGGGVAAGDYDGDGWVDLYVIRGDIGPNLLLHNLRNGTFEEVGAAAGLTLSSGSGPTFADMDGDGRLDLVVGGIDGAKSHCFHNLGNGHFSDVSDTAAIATNPTDVYSTALGDFDHDGDLDLMTTHWASNARPRLWRNNGNGTFTEISAAAAGLDSGPTQIFSFTPNFTDINNDGWPDLLLTADFGTSQIYINNRNGTFTRTTNAVITDENGMGSAVGDYDNDGDLDWFVASIYDPSHGGTWGTTGNRLYRNHGDGTFDDVTDQAGVRQGFWGWGSSFSDFNNDGNLDIFHVNGFPGSPFTDDPARMFVSNGNLTFTQRAEELGIADTGEGRGIAVFDYDHDGDLDVFITNAGQPTRFYRNDGGNALPWLDVRVTGVAPNTQAIGAKIFVTANGITQMREVRAGSNFVSQSPGDAHFGLGTASSGSVRVVWPDGTSSSPTTVLANRIVSVGQGLAPVTAVPTLAPAGLIVLVLVLGAAGALLLARVR